MVCSLRPWLMRFSQFTARYRFKTLTVSPGTKLNFRSANPLRVSHSLAVCRSSGLTPKHMRAGLAGMGQRDIMASPAPARHTVRSPHDTPSCKCKHQKTARAHPGPQMQWRLSSPVDHPRAPQAPFVTYAGLQTFLLSSSDHVRDVLLSQVARMRLRRTSGRRQRLCPSS